MIAFRFSKHFPFWQVSVFDPVSYTQLNKKWRFAYVNAFWELWEHLKYRLFKRPVGKVYLMIAEAPCSCLEGTHRRIGVRFANRHHAENTAYNQNLYSRMQYAMNISYDPLQDVGVPAAMRMGGKHEGTGPVNHYIKEFPDPEAAFNYITKLNEQRRKEGGMGAPLEGLPFGGGQLDALDNFDSETTSIRDVGGALVMTRRTSRTTPQQKPRNPFAGGPPKKDDPTN